MAAQRGRISGGMCSIASTRPGERITVILQGVDSCRQAWAVGPRCPRAGELAQSCRYRCVAATHMASQVSQWQLLLPHACCRQPVRSDDRVRAGTACTAAPAQAVAHGTSGRQWQRRQQHSSNHGRLSRTTSAWNWPRSSASLFLTACCSADTLLRPVRLPSIRSFISSIRRLFLTTAGQGKPTPSRQARSCSRGVPRPRLHPHPRLAHASSYLTAAGRPLPP